MSQPPTCFVIFGATGDLASRKLFPSLLDLFDRDLLPEPFTIVGFSRREFSHEEFRDRVRSHFDTSLASPETVEAFLERVYYVPGTFGDAQAYARLGDFIASVEEEYKTYQCANKLFYLSVSHEFYMTIIKDLAESGLSAPCGTVNGWARILIEKPFGKDAATAQKLDETLGMLFEEDQIYRIDHYLAKESLQNILSFRFFNALFEPVWNKDNIERVEATLFEDNTADGRGSFYDATGALRDVGQNHLLQMLALVAMERPATWEPRDIQNARARVLDALELPPCDDRHILRGQYVGYRDVDGVEQDSHTETYFEVTSFIRTPRWEGVPFVLASGKALSREEVAIRVFFKRPECSFDAGDEMYGGTNQITFRIKPDEGINVHFWFKVPGFGMKLEERTLSFLYSGTDTDNTPPDAYERVLYDCIRGDRTLFASTDEVVAAWRFIAPLFGMWQSIGVHQYERGTDPWKVKEAPFLK